MRFYMHQQPPIEFSCSILSRYYLKEYTSVLICADKDDIVVCLNDALSARYYAGRYINKRTHTREAEVAFFAQLVNAIHEVYQQYVAATYGSEDTFTDPKVDMVIEGLMNAMPARNWS